MRHPRIVLFFSLLAGFAACKRSDAGSEQSGTAAPATGPITVSGVGLSTPESVLHDSAADVYLVSNINGEPTGKDDNGFITQLNPDGSVKTLKWIDGADSTVTLNAPKGMAIRGDTLYVADIDSVRRFVRTTGRPAGAIGFPGATFLNDIATDSNGTLYVTDSGLKPDFSSSGTDAVWRFTPDGQTSKLIEGSVLGAPNGIAFRGQDAFVVTFGSGEIYQLGPNNNRQVVLPGDPKRQLDGIVFTKDGGYLFSSWGDKTVHRVAANGATSAAATDVESPADIGYDAKRDRVLIPLFSKNEVRIVPLAGPAPAGAAGASGATGATASSGAAAPTKP